MTQIKSLLWDSKTSCFLIAAGLSLAISLLNELRNYKFWDKRTNIYRYVTKLIIGLWVCFVPFALRVAYLQIGRPELRPKWQIMVNGFPLTGQTPMPKLTIPTTNDLETLYIFAVNSGNVGADGLVVDIGFPAGNTNWVSCDGAWIGKIALQKDASGHFGGDPSFLTYSVISPQPVPAGVGGWRCPPIYVHPPNDRNLVFNMQIFVSSPGSEVEAGECLFEFTRGTGSPFLRH